MEATKEARSPAMHPTLMLALNAGLRAGEIKNLKWLHIGSRKGIPDGRQKQDGSQRRPDHSVEPVAAGRTRTTRGTVRPSFRPDRAGLVPLPVRTGKPPRPHAPDDVDQDRLEQRPKAHGRRGSDARFQAHTHNRTLREWRR